MDGLYFHIPFCKRVCAYCDFYKSVDLRRMDPLLESMHRELDERRGYPGGEAVTTRYFGGGTPSLCTPEAIRGLLDHAARLFDCSGAEETTLEANPDDLTAEYLDGLLEAGIEVGYSKEVRTGFKVGAKEGGYYISFADADIEALLAEYLRDKVFQLLFKA